MCDWLVDANVVVKWVLTEPDSATALKVVFDVNAAGGSIAALDLAFIEAANALWVRFHRRLLTSTELDQAWSFLQAAKEQIVSAIPFASNALDISKTFDIAVYDAMFVAPTRALARSGVTADEPLVRAVGSACPEIKLLRNW